MAATVELTDRQKETLRALQCFGDWARPLDIGGRDCSHHSKTLAQLVKLGMAERRTRGSDRSFKYRAIQAGE